MELDNMTNAITNRPTAMLNEKFPYKICINLDRRPERWQQMQRKFDRHGIYSVRRFPAVDGNKVELPANWAHTPGAYGCLMSHLEVVREARRLGVSNVLILEDDVVFDDHLQKKLVSYLQQLPPDWDMLFFGALHKDEPIKVANNIALITQAYSTYAYVLRDTVFDDFIALNQTSEAELDNNNQVLQQQFNCYCFMPHLAWVEAGHSDAQLRLVDHWYLRESLVLFGPQVDRLLSQTTIIFAHENHEGGGSATENLIYLVNYYDKFFLRQIAIMIVEQGDQPTLDPATLPPNCKYIFLRDGGLFNREQCFVTGISHLDSSSKFIILSDSNIYLETLDIRANLRMCEKHDYSTGFSKIIDLTREESARLRTSKTTQGIDILNNSSAQNERPGYCRFFRREAIRMLVEGDSGGLEKVGLLSLPENQQLRVFQSPNSALRLQRD